MYRPNNWYLYDIAGNPNYSYGVESTFTTGTATAVNGACGTASGQTFSAPPTANLCSTGMASGLTNVAGAMSWSCGGQYGGTAASCSATITPATACYAQPTGLVSWWKGDDDATDHMGNNNGTLENSAGFALGLANDAFSLNGSNQFVLIAQPVPPDLQITNAITLSAWIYPTAYPTGTNNVGLIVGSQHDGTTSGATIFFDGRTNNYFTGTPPGHIHFQIGDGSWHESDSLTQIPLNQWTLITAVRTANNTAQIYYNGVLQPTQSQAWTGNITYTGAWFAIGQQSDANRPFAGLIDEVQVYNTALSAADVLGIYNAGTAGVCP
jgi:hypothetical protein